MKKQILLTLLTIIFYQVGFAQAFDKNKLDNYFNTLETNNKFMGSVAVSKNGTLIYTKSVGFADIKNEMQADENSKYRIGSISKTFTAVIVLKGVEEGKINLDKTIDKYFPNIPNSKQITVEHLLRHRSGIHNFTDDNNYLTWNTQPKTEKEMVNLIAKGGSNFTPGSKAEYSNSNFVLLSYILEKTFKKSYQSLLQHYITQPLQLKNTYLGGKITPNNDECESYKYIGNWIIQPETDISIPLGAGGIVSTPSDLTKFSNALFSGKILKPENLERMKDIKDGYGIGLFHIPFGNKISYGHTGGIDGFSSVFSHFTDENISFALTSNGVNYKVNNVAIAVLSAVFGEAYEIPEFSKYAISTEDLDKYLGVYSSQQIPLKITITKHGNTLIAQGTEQPSFPLEAIEKDKFEFDQAGVVLEFNPTEKTMILFQGGGQIKFTKEN